MTRKKIKLSVFGGTGFVGSHYCKNTDRDIVLMPREKRKPASSDVLYFISTTHNYHVFTDLHKDVETNLTVLLDVLKNLNEGDTFNFISSWYVYGSCKLPAKETNCCHPKGFYSITKLAAEQLLASYCDTFNIKYRILRLCNVYGPGDFGVSAQKNALQFLIDKLKRDEPVPLYHGGNFVRDYLHVSDVARAIDCCIDGAMLNQIINIGRGVPQKFRDLILMAKDALKSSSAIEAVNPSAFHQVVQSRDFYMNVDKLTSLGFTPRISIEEGIEDLCH